MSGSKDNSPRATASSMAGARRLSLWTKSSFEGGGSPSASKTGARASGWSWKSRWDPDKARSWAYYVAYLCAKYDLPVVLVAVCRDRATAEWAMGPLECAVASWPTQTTRPIVLGPQTVPEMTDEATVAQRPALAVLSAMRAD